MKLLVYGGTFDPVHNGHVHLAREFARRIGADRVLLVPTRTPPHKSAPWLAAPRHRLAMCELAAKGDGFAVSDLELRRKGKSYTARTLADLHEQEPGEELFFLMGEDMFLTLKSWYEPEQICRLATLCVAPRGANGMAAMRAYEQELRPLGARCVFEDVPFLPISSTQVRAAAAGESIAGLVPPGVAEYISVNGLYREQGEGSL